MRIDIISIFPEYLTPLELSLIGKARRAGLLQVSVHDLRDFTYDRHRTVDDAPVGGGAGLVMLAEPWAQALDHVTAAQPAGIAGPPTLVVLTPAGHPLTHAVAEDLATRPWLVLACGRYEGIDERFTDDAADRMPVLPLSIGDYVLAGGEAAALVVVEAVTRLVPGVLGNAESLAEESHEDGLLEYPVYSRPAQWRSRAVPEVLTSGHHARVQRWRRDERLRRTAARRPDLVARLSPGGLDARDLAILADAGWVPGDAGFRRLGADVAD
jgi:tRNA (guanine37-N1)-methyltransferase